MKKKTYYITGYAYVALDAEVLAASKKEAKEKYLKSAENNQLGFDYELRIHEVVKQGVMISKKEFTKNNGIIFTNGKYFIR